MNIGNDSWFDNLEMPVAEFSREGYKIREVFG
jgi:hypothetical protein